MGRRLQELAGQEPQICLTLPILRGLDGERRMGKSLGNYVGVGMPAQEQFDRTMSIPDALMGEWLLLLTNRSPEEIAALLDPKTHPMATKKTLGRDIVTFYHGAEAAVAAQEGWERRFSQKQDPTEIPEVDLPALSLVEGRLAASKLLVAVGLAASNNEARRLVQGGGVTVGPERTKLADGNAAIEVTTGLILRVGSRKIVRVRIV